MKDNIDTILLPQETAVRSIFAPNCADTDSMYCPASSPCYMQHGSVQHRCLLSPRSTQYSNGKCYNTIKDRTVFSRQSKNYYIM